jgi:hypothetical protein
MSGVSYSLAGFVRREDIVIPLIHKLFLLVKEFAFMVHNNAYPHRRIIPKFRPQRGMVENDPMFLLPISGGLIVSFEGAWTTKNFVSCSDTRTCNKSPSAVISKSFHAELVQSISKELVHSLGSADQLHSGD